jgi:acyl-CoA synthetase (AMP-forming)/AMP-acid ligase II
MSKGLLGAANVVDVIRERAATLGERNALTFVRDPRARDDCSLTYRRLDERAVALAGWLRRMFRQGDRMLLLYPPGLEFTVGFLACLYSGLVAVPAPMPDNYKRQAERLRRVAVDADCAGVLTESTTLADVSAWAAASGLPGLRCRASDAPEDTEPDAWTMPDIGPDTLALLQYTSGSTSDPKGVMVSHRNFLHNADIYHRSLGFAEERNIGGWAPHYHDMGLIAQMLPALLFGSTSVLMAPTAFVRRPYSWLSMIDGYDIGVSLAPNFGFELCTRRITDEQLSELDLSRWDVAVNGSEPVRASTMAEFSRRFAPAGFRATALRPCYGMAEATVYISGATSRLPRVRQVDAELLEAGTMTEPRPGTTPRAVVSCGRALGFDVRIVDPVTRQVRTAGRVGEIWLRGESVAQGYWRNEQATRETFRARTADGDTGYLRTGDLGVCHDGEIYVTGRAKEVVVVHGRNLYPQDLEYTVRSACPELENGYGAVFTVNAADEETDSAVVMVHEVKGRPAAAEAAAITAAVRTCLVREFGIAAAGVVLLRPGGVHRTTSGKIQRVAMREAFLAGLLDAVHEDIDDRLRELRAAAAPGLPVSAGHEV